MFFYSCSRKSSKKPTFVYNDFHEFSIPLEILTQIYYTVLIAMKNTNLCGVDVDFDLRLLLQLTCTTAGKMFEKINDSYLNMKYPRKMTKKYRKQHLNNLEHCVWCNNNNDYIILI